MKDPTGNEHLTPVKITSTSATERAGFRNCRRNWLLGSVHHLDPGEPGIHTFLGTIYHAALETYYKGRMDGMSHDDAAVASKATYIARYQTDLEAVEADLGFLAAGGLPSFEEFGALGQGMLANYLDKEEKDPLVDEVIAVEERVHVGIWAPGTDTPIGVLSVQTDIVGIKDGELIVADHKTASRAIASSHLDLDDQLTAEVYSWWQHSGDMPTAAIYNVSYKVASGPPKLLKNGKKLSQDKGQGTTHALYLAEIHKHGFDVADYADMLLFLSEREQRGESPLFSREKVFRTPGQMEAFERDLYWEFTDMQAVARRPERAYPNPNKNNCGWCEYRPICTAIQDDGDVSAVIKSGYRIAEARRPDDGTIEQPEEPNKKGV